MAFDYNSRTKWENERLERWNQEHEKQIKKLKPAKKEIFEEVGNFSDYPHCGFPVIRKWTTANVSGSGAKYSGRSLKEIMLGEFADLEEILVPAQYREDY